MFNPLRRGEPKELGAPLSEIGTKKGASAPKRTNCVSPVSRETKKGLKTLKGVNEKDGWKKQGENKGPKQRKMGEKSAH